MSTPYFYYSLRLGVDPKNWTDKKMSELKQLIHSAGLNDINLIINSEELNVGHITKEQLAPWLRLTEKFKEELEPLGVRISMNPWTTILHSDRGRVLSDTMNFGTMVDYQGHKATAVACPMDKNFVSYISAIYGEYAKINPEYLWMDDDFRHFNHGALSLGCFCEQHMELFNQTLNTTHTSEAFSKLVFQTGEPTKERIAYLTQSRKEMNELARAIANSVRSMSPTTKLGLMTSQPEWHAVEGRDWSCLFDSLSLEQPKIARPHLPAYNEIPGLKYIREFNRKVRPVAHLMPEGSEMYPELENYMYSPYAKSNAFTQLQLETVILIGAKGILFNFYDMMGNGVVSAYNHQKVLRESRPLLDYSVEKPIDLSSLSGIKVLYSQETTYTRQLEKATLEEMLPREYEWLALLSTFGISNTLFAAEKVKELTGEMVAVSDQVLRNLTDEAIIHLFEKNQVMLDGTSVVILCNRKLAYLIGATDYERLVPHTGIYTYEEWMGSELIEGVEHPRMTVMQQTGDLININYEPGAVEILTSLYDEAGQRVGNAMAIGKGRHFILPITYHPRYAWDAQYINYKEKIFKLFLEKTAVDYVVEMPVVQFLREKNRLFITNFTLDSYDKIKVKLTGFEGKENIDSCIISRKEKRQQQFSFQENYFEVDYRLEAFETIVIELDSNQEIERI